jgi:hypothetical protein
MIDSNHILKYFFRHKKAFDSVNHNILLKKLYQAGIRGNIYNLIKSYLSNRLHVVKINNTFSNQLLLSHEVP